VNSLIVYGIYTQFEPTYKYESTLESIWSTKELADEALTRIADYMDHKWISEIYLNSDCLNLPPEENK
jgi:hypothetical protein